MQNIIATLVFFITVIPSFAQALKCEEVPKLMSVMLENHFSIHELNENIKGRTVELFLQAIDPSKQVLLKSDEKLFRKSLNSLFDAMERNDCAALTQVSKILVQRSQEDFDIVKEMLKGKFTLDENAQFQTDAKKRDYPVDFSAKKKSIEAGIQVQIADSMAAGDVTMEQATKQLLKRYELATKKIKETIQDQEELLILFTESFAQSLDPHSNYFSPEQLEEFNDAMGLSLEGIGVRLSFENGYSIIEEIVPGGGADRSQALRPKDKIISVAQGKEEPVSIVDMDRSDVLKLIRGDKGTQVTLSVIRKEGAKNKTFRVTIVRDKIDMEEQAARMVFETRKVAGKSRTIAVIELPSFYGGAEDDSRNSYLDMKKLVEEAAAKKVDGMILDLTSNGGGLLSTAVQIAGLFIKTGPVVATEDMAKNQYVAEDKDPAVTYAGPLLILTSPLSASASEILAGTLKDYGRALIVGGERTYGKGSVQNVKELAQGLGAVKLTTQMFFLPKGESTQYAGVTSNITMPYLLDASEIGEKNLDYALPPTKTDSFISVDSARSKAKEEFWSSVEADLVNSLKKKSSKRVATNEEFKEIQKNLDETKKNQGWVKVGEVLNSSDTEKQKLKEIREEARTVKGRQELWFKNPHLQESINIMADWLTYNNSRVQGNASKS